MDILDNSGSVVAKYKYDAWGKCQTTVIDSNTSIIAQLSVFAMYEYPILAQRGIEVIRVLVGG